MKKILLTLLVVMCIMSMMLGVFGCDKKEVESTPHEHTFVEVERVPATCEKDGKVVYKCSGCDETKEEVLPALGHSYAEGEFSPYLIPCTREGCGKGKMPPRGDEYDKMIATSNVATLNAEFEGLLAECEDAINALGPYDSTLHKYAEGSDLEATYIPIYEKINRMKDIIKYDLYFERRKLEIRHSIDFEDDAVLQELTDCMMLYSDYNIAYNELLAKAGRSAVREYVFYGINPNDIDGIIESLENNEGSEIEKEVNRLLMEFDTIEDLGTDPRTPELYSRYVEANNKYAQSFGFNNYLEFAYEYIYLRDYTPEEVVFVNSFIKQYIAPYGKILEDEIERIMAVYSKSTDEKVKKAYNTYVDITQGSYFEDVVVNKNVNDYLRLLNYETSNKSVSYYDQLCDMVSEGYYFRGTEDVAYASRLTRDGTPIVYFGPQFERGYTFVHEFGHHMADVCSGTINISYDLSETHSQANELMYLSYLRDVYADDAIIKDLVTADKLRDDVWSILAAASVNAFEYAVYTGRYTGLNSDKIMADGKITYDEYDYLFTSIVEDFGGTTYSAYWRYTATTSSAYYISYAVSLMVSTELYVIAEEEGLDKALDSYFRLISYIEEDPDGEMTYSDIIKYASLYKYNNVTVYKNLSRTLDALMDDLAKHVA